MSKMAGYGLNSCHSLSRMDVDPKVTTGSELNGNRTRDSSQPDVTETSAPILLKGRYVLGPELGRGGFAITYSPPISRSLREQSL
jgi:hypothetical protein